MGLPVLVLPEFSCNDVQLQQEITMLSGQINVANYRLLKLIAEFDSRRAWRCGGTVRSCAHWLAAQCGMTIGAARERVRVARSLGVLPEVDSAFSTGGLSYSKVRAITAGGHAAERRLYGDDGGAVQCQPSGKTGLQI